MPPETRLDPFVQCPLLFTSLTKMKRVDNILLAFLNNKCYENPSGDSRGFIYVEQLLEVFLKFSLRTRKKPELTPSYLPDACYRLIQSRV
jgi:hypothetical protein